MAGTDERQNGKKHRVNLRQLAADPGCYGGKQTSPEASGKVAA
jgi:hypothetical protein